MIPTSAPATTTGSPSPSAEPFWHRTSLPGCLTPSPLPPRRRCASAAPARPGRWVLWLLVGLLALRLVSAFVLANSGIQHEHNILGGDGRRYDEISTSAGTPYRDFEVEYPPVTLAVIELTHGPDLYSTLARLIASQLVFDLATIAVLAWAWDRRTALAYLVLSTPLVLFPFLYVRIDLISVFLATLGLGLVRKGYDRLGGASLAVAVYAKVWPAVLAPVLLIERKVKATAAWAVTLVVGALAWLAWSGTEGFSQVLTFRGAKGWQIESLVGVWYHWTDPAGSHVEAGAWRTAAAMPPWARTVLTGLSGLTVVVAWVLAARRRWRGDDDSVVYGLAPLVCVLGLLVFAPILSPQYILWMLPAAAVVTARRNWVMAGLTLAVTSLTAVVFASIEAQTKGQLHAMVPLVTRNALLVAMLVVGVVQLARPLRRAPSSPSDDDARPIRHGDGDPRVVIPGRDPRVRTRRRWPGRSSAQSQPLRRNHTTSPTVRASIQPRAMKYP